MGLLGLESTAMIADRIFALMDRTNSGRVRFEEYLDYMDILMHGTPDERATQSFNLITLGKKPVITFDDFTSWLISVWKMYNAITGSRISAEEASIRQHFDFLDLNHDGVVDLIEYKASMKRNSSSNLFEWFDFINKGLVDNFHPDMLEEGDPHKSVVLAGLEKLEIQARRCLDVIEGEETKIPFPPVSPKRLYQSLKLKPDYGRRLFSPDLSRDRLVGTAPKVRVDISEIKLKIDSCLENESDDEGEVKVPQARSFVVAKQPFASNSTAASDNDSKLRTLQSNLEAMLNDIEVLKSQVKTNYQPPESPHLHAEHNVPKSVGTNPKFVTKQDFVHWGDENWNLVLNMMLGIQKAVKCAAANFNPLVELADQDFSERCKHKLLAGYVKARAGKVCKFRDIAPNVFEHIRRLYNISAEQYIKSLGVEKIMRSLTMGEFSSLIGLCSTGKSGSFFYYSDDGKFLLKTMTRDEYLFFCRLLRSYYEHVRSNPNTLLPRFFGFHKIIYFNNHRSNKIYFVVMANVFNTSREIQERYDLKGSTHGRDTNPEADYTVARKDLDFLAKDRKIVLGPLLKEMLLTQLERDCMFFVQHRIIDYSLLLGIHTLSAPLEEDPRPSPRFAEANCGGLLSEDRSVLYFFGIIDVFTLYSTKKKLEHAFRGSFYGPDAISCVPPRNYAERFLEFMNSITI
jgi:1-phosphatidylinositol-4-phosphate 5-kinase